MKQILKAIADRFIGKIPLLKRRSGRWPTVRKHFLEQHPTCAACNCKDELEIHHIVPFHINSSLELEESNLITLCEGKNRCHLKIGHHGNWSYVNPNVREEAAKILENMKSNNT